MDTRRATKPDIERIQALLVESGLPRLPSSTSLSNVIVALDEGTPVGGIALEVYGRTGLVRSAVVAPDRRRRGIGSSMLRSIIARGHELGLRDLYVITEDASDFFAPVGFAAIDRSEVPGEIRRSREFKEQCPESASVMRLPLATRW